MDNVKEQIIRLYESLKNMQTKEDIENIQFYKELQIIPETSTKIGLSEDVYLVQKQMMYELYLNESQKIATISDKGEIVFEESYLELLRKNLKEYYDKIGIEDRKILLKNVLEERENDKSKESIGMTKEEIEEQQEIEKENSKDQDIKKEEQEEQVEEQEEQEEQEEKEEQEEQKEQEDKQDELPEQLEGQIKQTTGIRKEDVRACTKINPQEKISDTENFYDIVPSAKKYVQIYVVASNKTEKQNSKFYFMGITSDGKAERIEGLEPTEGTNTTKEVISINRDGSQIKESQVSALFKVGNYNKGFSVSIGNYGIIEAQYVRRTQNNEYISTNINTTTQKPTTKQVKEFMSDTKNPYIQDNVDKAQEQIEENQSEKTNIENIDDNKYNDKVINVDEQIELKDGTITTVRKEAEKLNVDVQEYVNRCEKDTSQTMQEKIENTNEEIINEKQGEIEMDEESGERTPWGDAYRRMMNHQ